MQTTQPILDATLDGHRGRAERRVNPHPYNTLDWLAWRAGYELAAMGWPAPLDARKVKGDAIQARYAKRKIKVSFSGERAFVNVY